MERPQWFAVKATQKGLIYTWCVAVEGPPPRLVLVDACGFVLAGFDALPLPRHMLSAPCEAGATYYVGVVSEGTECLVSLCAAQSADVIERLGGGAGTDRALVDYALPDPSWKLVALPERQPVRLAMDVGEWPVDVSLVGLDGRVAFEQPAVKGAIEATVAASSGGPHLLTLMPVSVVEEGTSASVSLTAMGPEKPATLLYAGRQESFTLEEVSAQRTAIAELDPGWWEIMLAGEQYNDHLRLVAGLSGRAERLTAAKPPGEASAALQVLVARPTVGLFSVHYVSGPGHAQAQLLLKREPGPWDYRAGQAPPGAQVAGWSAQPVRGGAIYSLVPAAGARAQPAFYNAGSAVVHGSEALPALGAVLILRPIEDGVVFVRQSEAGQSIMQASVLLPPEPAARPTDAAHAAPLPVDGTVVRVVLTPEAQEAWFRFEAEAGACYAVASSEELACDLDVTVLAAGEAEPLWSDGELPDIPGLPTRTRLRWVCPKAGPYLLRVAPHVPIVSALASAKLMANVEARGPPLPTPCAVGSTVHTPTSAALDAPLVGRLGAWRDGYLAFSAPPGSLLSVDPGCSSFVHTGVRFVDADGEPLLGHEYATGQPESLPPVSAPADGAAFLHIVNWSSAFGYYRICVRAAK